MLTSFTNMHQTQKKFKVVTLGCRTNQYESQAYTNQLIELGYGIAKEGESADLCIVNTCTVTENADKSSRHEIIKLASENPQAKIVVTGCFAENNPDLVLSLPQVTTVVKNHEKEDLIQKVFPEIEVPEFSIKHFEAHTRAFVKVQDGCNSFCTYCVIPYVRGRSRSRAIPDIIQEIKDLVKNGYKEIVLTGINIGDFDGNPHEGEAPFRLRDLVRAADAVDGVERLRISSIDPDEIDEDLQDAVINGKKTCPSMHMVLQHGSNVILKRMNRKYTRQIFLETADRLKKACPEFTFTTDIIVGFPGETDQDFQETLEVVDEIKFAKVHMFPYSERPRTRAKNFPNKVPPSLINKRKRELMVLTEKASFRLREEFLGSKMWVLTESRDEKNPSFIEGHTANFLNVRILSRELKSNQLVEVELVQNTPSGFIGKVVDSSS